MKKTKSDLEKQIESLPNVRRGVPAKWTLQQNAMILKYYNTKGGAALAKIMGVAYSTLRKQYLHLKGMMK